MFADDTNLFISNFNMDNLIKTMNKERRKVASWFKANKLSLNISKTNYSIFHSMRKRKDIPNILPPLHIGNGAIKRKIVAKFLDESFSWRYDINIVNQKVFNGIGIFYRNFHILNNFLRKKLYFSFINRYFIYANKAWASTKKSKLQALYCHQKPAARTINLKDKLTSSKPLIE